MAKKSMMVLAFLLLSAIASAADSPSELSGLDFSAGFSSMSDGMGEVVELNSPELFSFTSGSRNLDFRIFANLTEEQMSNVLNTQNSFLNFGLRYDIHCADLPAIGYVKLGANWMAGTSSNLITTNPWGAYAAFGADIFFGKPAEHLLGTLAPSFYAEMDIYFLHSTPTGSVDYVDGAMPSMGFRIHY